MRKGGLLGRLPACFCRPLLPGNILKKGVRGTQVFIIEKIVPLYADAKNGEENLCKTTKENENFDVQCER